MKNFIIKNRKGGPASTGQGGFLQLIIIIVIALLLMRYYHMSASDVLAWLNALAVKFFIWANSFFHSIFG